MSTNSDVRLCGSSVVRGVEEPLRRIWRTARGKHVTSLADQAIVSGTSFLTLTIIGRWSDSGQLGAYAIAYSVLALLVATQSSLITRPYTIQLHQSDSPAEHAFSSLALNTILSAVAVLGACGFALTLDVAPAYGEIAHLAYALAAAAPFVLLREFARRLSFANFRLHHALFLDTAVAALTAGQLGWLGWSGRLSAASALGAVGLACGVGAIGWLYVARRDFLCRGAHITPTLKRSWGFGRWLFCSQIAGQAQGYSVHWLTMLFFGPAATGVYAACVSIVSLINPLLFGMVNILTPNSVRALRTAGRAGLRRQAIFDACLLALLIFPFVGLVVLFGDTLMSVLYVGPGFQGNGVILDVLSLAMLAGVLGTPASIALASAERGREIAFLSVTLAVLGTGLAFVSMMLWGLIGAACGLLIGEVLGSITFWLAFLTLVPDVSRPDLKSGTLAGDSQCHGHTLEKQAK